VTEHIFKNRKIMKKIALTLVALLTMTVAGAQNCGNNDCSKNSEECGKDKKECCKNGKKAPKEMTAQQRTERMAKQLSLSEDQKAQLQALNEKYQDALKRPAMPGHRLQKAPKDKTCTITDANSAPTSGLQQKCQECPQLTDTQKKEMKQGFEKRKAYETELKKILTDDQYKEYQRMQPHHHGHKGPKGEMPSGPIPEKKN